MLKSGIINPQILSLLARFRHTNTIVIGDWAFPFWPEIETVDISLGNGIPSVLDVFKLVNEACHIGQIRQAKEFIEFNEGPTINAFADAMNGIPIISETHDELKERVPRSIGIIRTGDDTLYGNLILESA